jgi:hypothetical protein
LNQTGQFDREVRRIQANDRAKQAAQAAPTAPSNYSATPTATTASTAPTSSRTPSRPRTASCSARGGIIVACAPDTAEVRETLFTGFATGALERGINQPQWGLGRCRRRASPSCILYGVGLLFVMLATVVLPLIYLAMLAAALDRCYKDLRVSWNLNKRLPENFPASLLAHHARLTEAECTRLEDTLDLQPTKLFDTHPSNGDRIRCARQANDPGVFHLDVPASALFSNFDVVAKQVTLLHYADDLRVPMEVALLVPVKSSSEAA